MRRRRKWWFVTIACVCTLLLLAAVTLHLAREASEAVGLPTTHHSLPEPVQLANCLTHSGWRASKDMGKLMGNTENLRNTVSFHSTVSYICLRVYIGHRGEGGNAGVWACLCVLTDTLPPLLARTVQ